MNSELACFHCAMIEGKVLSKHSNPNPEASQAEGHERISLVYLRKIERM